MTFYPTKEKKSISNKFAKNATTPIRVIIKLFLLASVLAASVFSVVALTLS